MRSREPGRITFLEADVLACELKAADEAFERLYAPWPLRLYVVRGAELAWIAEPDGATFEPAVARLRAMFNLE